MRIINLENSDMEKKVHIDKQNKFINFGPHQLVTVCFRSNDFPDKYSQYIRFNILKVTLNEVYGEVAIDCTNFDWDRSFLYRIPFRYIKFRDGEPFEFMTIPQSDFLDKYK